MADFMTNTTNTSGGATVNQINTNSIAIFGAESTMLRIAFRNETMFLTIIPRVMKEGDPKPRWPRENGHSVALRPQQAAALYRAFEQAILPDIEKGQDHMGYAAIPLNRDSTNLCGFTYGGGRVMFSIFSGVSLERTCSDVTTFIFDTTPVINDYNPNTGAYNVLEVQGQAFVIVWALKNFAEMVSNVAGHNVKVANAYNQDMMMSYLQGMITKLGVTPGGYGSYRGRAGANAAPMGGYANDGPSATAAQLGLMAPPSGSALASLSMPNTNPLPNSNDAVSWNSSYAESATVGHDAMPPMNQVGQLSDLIG